MYMKSLGGDGFELEVCLQLREVFGRKGEACCTFEAVM
jgi:hypothetical protein